MVNGVELAPALRRDGLGGPEMHLTPPHRVLAHPCPWAAAFGVLSRRALAVMW
jgi:hypothetical protein